MAKLTTNKLVFTPNENLISSDFDFYKISTNEKYISSGAYFLDSLSSGTVISIVYESGRNFYIMTKKDATTTNEIIDILRNQEKGEALSIEKQSIKKIPENNRLQLFLNGIGSSDSEYFSFNNLTGKLYCYNTMWINVDRKTNFIWGLQCLEIKITKNMTLKLSAHQMNSILLKNNMIFQKRKFEDFPQYCFSDTNKTLRRVSKKELNEKANFIIKPVNNEKSIITFFDFSEPQNFSASKIGCLYDILKILNNKYGKYFTLEFEKFEISMILNPKRKELTAYKSIVAKTINEKGINFIDCINSSTSLEHLHDIATEIQKLIPNVEFTFNNELSNTQLNIRYIKDKSCYEENTDPHQDDLSGFLVQHITNEYDKDCIAATENILKELAIKKDIQSRKISLDDWTLHNYESDWIFGVKKDDLIEFIRIHSDGSFDFEKVENTFFGTPEYDIYTELFSQNEVIGFVQDSEGNINVIKETNMYTLPDFMEVGNILEEEGKKEKITGSIIIQILQDLSKSDEKFKPTYDEIAMKIEANREYKKNEILNLFNSRSVVKPKQIFVDKIYNDLGIRLKSYLRSTEQREKNFSGTIDINYIPISPTAAYYCVGEIGNGMKAYLERASIIRQIEAVNSSKLIFEKLLPLMSVEFVRYGMLTVMPYPFKFLRELK